MLNMLIILNSLRLQDWTLINIFEAVLPFLFIYRVYTLTWFKMLFTSQSGSS